MRARQLRSIVLRAAFETLDVRLSLAVTPAPIFTPDAVPDGIDGPPWNEEVDPPEDYGLFEQPTIQPGVVPVSATNWVPVGPAPINGGIAPGGGPCVGRIAGIAVDPTDSNTLFVASASGGVWKTTNSGTSWTPLTDNQSNLSLGSIAIAPTNHNVIYAGTGEASNATFEHNYGSGILKSVDGGSTWSMVGTAQFNRLCIGKIAVDPTNANIAFAAVSLPRRIGAATGTGIFKTVDGGANWTNTTSGITSIDSWTDVVINPLNPQILYAADGNRDVALTVPGGVYKSINGGASWSPAGNYPMSNVNGRTALAISPSLPSTIYAQSQNQSTSGVLRWSRSTDSGATWTDLTANVPAMSQMWYNNVLVVNPTNPNIVVTAGNVNLYRTTDGGATFTSINTDASGFGPHVDHHALVYDSAGRLLNGNDGGIWRLSTVSPTGTWSDLNGNMQITQFVGVAIHPTNNSYVLGGTQDNGTLATTGQTSWTLREGGDGGEVAFSTTNPNVVYHIAPVGSFGAGAYFRRSDNGGVSFVSKTTGLVNSANSTFYPPFVVDPSNGARVALGTDVVNLTTNGGDNWAAISPVLRAGATVDSVAISKTDPNTIYAAAGGHMFITTNGGANWTERSAPLTDHIYEITIDPANSQIAYAMRDRFSGAKVYRTTNGGVSWTDISGNLPDLPATTIALEGAGAAATLYLGLDNGVYVSTNLGTTWQRYGAGLPNVWVRDLEINTNHVLVAGTYGRGAFEIYTQSAVLTGINGNVFNDANANGILDSGEAGLPNRTVFLDQNGNATLDSATITPASTNVPVAINDLSTVTSVLNVSGTSGAIQRVTLTLNITHTFDGDLVATLINPAGTRVELFASVGDAGQNFVNTTLDDQASTFIANGTAPFTGSFIPGGLLANFKGQSANGTWTLEIADIGPGDVGTLNSWSLSLSTGELTTLSDSLGNYSFGPALAPGTYHIGQVRPLGWRQTAPNAIFPANGLYDVTLATGQNPFGFDFGSVLDSVRPTVANDTFLFETAPQSLRIVFSEDVGASLSAADFSVINLANSQSVPFTLSYLGATSTASLTFSAILPDANYRLRVIAPGVLDNAGNALVADNTFDFYTLTGDANRDRVVDFSDLLIVAQNYGQSGRTFSQGNFDYSADGLVDFSDLLLLAQRYGTSLLLSPASSGIHSKTDMRSGWFRIDA